MFNTVGVEVGDLSMDVGNEQQGEFVKQTKDIMRFWVSVCSSDMRYSNKR